MMRITRLTARRGRNVRMSAQSEDRLESVGSMKSPELDKERRVDHSTRAPLISVLMPCYNAQETIEEAIKSIVSQTFALWELVIVDDGSTDGSCDRVTAWAARDARIRLIRQDHAGIVTALNTGWRSRVKAWPSLSSAHSSLLSDGGTSRLPGMDADPDL